MSTLVNVTYNKACDTWPVTVSHIIKPATHDQSLSANNVGHHFGDQQWRRPNKITNRHCRLTMTGCVSQAIVLETKMAT